MRAYGLLFSAGMMGEGVIPVALTDAEELPLSSAQDYLIPSSWIGRTPSDSLNETSKLAQAVLDTLSSSYDPYNGTIYALGRDQDANLFTGTVNYDSLTSSKANYDASLSRLLQVMNQLVPKTERHVSNDPLMWGLAAIYAYKAYQEQSFLNDAISIWQNYTIWMITRDDAANGTHPLKNGTFLSQCSGDTNAGGVFYYIDFPTDFSVTSGTEAAYMGLSAYLYDITNNQTYHDVAQLSLAFIQSHLYEVKSGHVVDAIGLSTCDMTHDVWTYEAGLYLEALTVFGYKTNNNTVIRQADEFAYNSIKLSLWTGSNGVSNEIPTHTHPIYKTFTNLLLHTYKGMLSIRGLYQHWTRSPRESDVATLIKAFLTVQYNNLINNTRAPGTSYYTPDWTGNPIPALIPSGQLMALDVFNSMIGMNADPLQPSTDPETSTDRSPSVGAIAGGVVGGVCFVAISVAIVAIIYRRRRAHVAVRNIPTSDGERQSILGYGEQKGILINTTHLIEPFPPPFPPLDGPPSAKSRNEMRYAANSAASPTTTRPSLLSPQSGAGNLEYTIPNGSSTEPSVAPPRYESIA